MQQNISRLITIIPRCKPLKGRMNFKIKGENFINTKNILLVMLRNGIKFKKYRGVFINANEISVEIGRFEFECHCEIKLFFNNEETEYYSILPFIVYKQPELTSNLNKFSLDISPNCGPFKGGTQIELGFQKCSKDINNTMTFTKVIDLPYTEDTAIKLFISNRSGQLILIDNLHPKYKNNEFLTYLSPKYQPYLNYLKSPLFKTNVSVAFDGRTYTNDLFFSYYNQPVICSISPTSVPSCGGTEITIKAVDLLPLMENIKIRLFMNDKVEIIEGNLDKNVTENTSYIISCKTPMWDLNSAYETKVNVDISLNGQDYGYNDLEISQLMIYFVPSLISLSHYYGLIGGGNLIEIKITNKKSYFHIFQQNKKESLKNNLMLRWYFQGNNLLLPLETSIFLRENKLYATTPNSHQNLRAEVNLMYNSELCPNSSQSFIFYEPPTLRTLFPLSGSTEGNLTLNIKGEGFLDTQTISVRIYNGKAVYLVLGKYITSDLIICIIPKMKEVGYYAVDLSLSNDSFVVSKPLLLYIYKNSDEIFITPTYNLNYFSAKIFINTYKILHPGDIYIKFIHESGIEETAILSTTPIIDWYKGHRKFYNLLLTKKNINDALEYVTEYELRRIFDFKYTHKIFTKLPNKFPPGRVNTYLSDDNINYRYINSDLYIITNPTIEFVEPNSLHVQGEENVRITGENIVDMGNVIVKFIKCGGSDTITINASIEENSINFLSEKFTSCGDWELYASLDGFHFCEPFKIAVFSKILIEDIKPNCCTTLGKVKIDIYGKGFVDTGNCIVKFILEEGDQPYEKTEKGILEDNHFTLMAPRFPESKIGKYKIDVSLNNRDWNNIYLITDFFVYPQMELISCKCTGDYMNELQVIGTNFKDLGNVQVEFTPITESTILEPILKRGEIISDTEMKCELPLSEIELFILDISLDGVAFTESEHLLRFRVPTFILNISPEWGIIKGGTIITLTGVNFFPSNQILVQFSYENEKKKALGTYIENNKVQCKTPNFTRYKANIAVDVDICFYKGKTLGVSEKYQTLQRFNYYVESPQIVSVVPISGPSCGNINIFINSKKMITTNEMFIKLRVNNEENEKILCLSSVKKNGTIQFLLPSFDISEDSDLYIQISFNGQDYSAITNKTKIKLLKLDEKEIEQLRDNRKSKIKSRRSSEIAIRQNKIFEIEQEILPLKKKLSEEDEFCSDELYTPYKSSTLNLPRIEPIKIEDKAIEWNYSLKPNKALNVTITHGDIKNPYLSKYIYKLFKNNNSNELLYIFQSCDNNWNNTLDVSSFQKAIKKYIPQATYSDITELWKFSEPSLDGFMDYNHLLNKIKFVNSQ